MKENHFNNWMLAIYGVQNYNKTKAKLKFIMTHNFIES